MNYVNKENAIALKDLGFEEKVLTYYFNNQADLFADDELRNYNLRSLDNPRVSAPDFLTVADWLFTKHQLEFTLRPNHTRIWGGWGNYKFPCNLVETSDEVEFTEAHGDHRNAAITYAIEQIKQKTQQK